MLARIRGEAGYSLVEVIVSIFILSAAIIPMVAMFDVGLKSASTSGNYDTARALANKKLEQAKSISYEDARDKFPRASDPTPGTYGPIDSTAEAGVPDNFSYTVRKRYLVVTPTGSDTTSNLAVASGGLGETGLIEITVTVNWQGKSYVTSGVVAKSVP